MDTSNFSDKTESDARYPRLTTLDFFGLTLGRRNVGADNSDGRTRVSYGRRVVAAVASGETTGTAGTVMTFVLSVLNRPGATASCRAWGHVVAGTF